MVHLQLEHSTPDDAIADSAAAATGSLDDDLTIDSATPDRGRNARSPREIPLRGWRDVLLRVHQEAAADNVGLIAAGMAFYALLSLAPALAVIISVFGLMVSPEELQSQMLVLSSYLPEEAQSLVQNQLTELVSDRSPQLTWGIAASIGVSLWGSSKAMKALFGGMNAVYDEVETRPWWLLTLQSLLFTLAGILLLVAIVATLGVLPLVLSWLPMTEFQSLLTRGVSWVVISTVVLCGLAVLYRFGPSRARPKWRWVTVGAFVAWIIWVAASAGFSWYVSNFDSYQRTYGALGAVAILLMWFFVSAYAVLIGGELNAELEHQTSEDSTVGGNRPLGERGAVVADKVGHVPRWRRGKQPVAMGQDLLK